MPNKRRTGKSRDHRLTPSAIEAWKAGDAAALHRALGLKPWMISPLRVEGECPYLPGTAGAVTWPAMQELRTQLIEAAAAE
jgi:hypothetical protein